MKTRLLFLWPCLALLHGPTYWQTMASPMFGEALGGADKGEIVEASDTVAQLPRSPLNTKSGTSLRPQDNPKDPFFSGGDVRGAEQILKGRPVGTKTAKIFRPKAFLNNALVRFRGWIGKFRDAKNPKVSYDPELASTKFIEQLTSYTDHSGSYIDVKGITRKVEQSGNSELRSSIFKYKRANSFKEQLRETEKVLTIFTDPRSSPEDKTMALEVLGLMVDPNPPGLPQPHTMVKVKYSLIDIQNAQPEKVVGFQILDAYMSQRIYRLSPDDKLVFTRLLRHVPWGRELLAPIQAVSQFDPLRFLEKYRSLEGLSSFSNIGNLKNTAQTQKRIVDEMAAFVMNKGSASSEKRTATLDALYWVVLPSSGLPQYVRDIAMDHIWKLAGTQPFDLKYITRGPPAFISTNVEPHLKTLSAAMMAGLNTRAQKIAELAEVEEFSKTPALRQIIRIQDLSSILPHERKVWNNEEREAYRFLQLVSTAQDSNVLPEVRSAATEALDNVRPYLRTPGPSPAPSRMASPLSRFASPSHFTSTSPSLYVP